MSFLTDIKTIRSRARKQINEGAVTPDYGLDPVAVCKVLNEALATEIVCVLRYKFHYFMAFSQLPISCVVPAGSATFLDSNCCF